MIAVLDRILSVLAAVPVAAAVIVYVFLRDVLSGNRRAVARDQAVRRLTLHIMNLAEEREKGEIEEDILLGGAIGRELSVFFDFESGTDFVTDISGSIKYFHFSVYKTRGGRKKRLVKTAALASLVRDVVRVKDAARREKINCVQSHESVFLGLIGVFLSRALAAPLVLHLNTSYDMKYKGTGRVSVNFLRFRFAERMLERYVMARSDVIMADRSSYADSGVVPLGLMKKHVVTGVKVNAVHYGDRPARPGSAVVRVPAGFNVILYAGRLHPVKYVEDLPEMFKAVYEKEPSAFMVIAGGGVLKARLEEKFREYGLGDRVLFTGARDQETLKGIYEAADIVVQPHGGQVLIEAALAGKPACVYDFDCHREFVEDGSTGYVVPFRDAAALAEKVTALLKDKTLRERMGRAGRESALKKYSRKTSIENERRIYDKIIRA